MSQVTVARMNLIDAPRSEEVPDNAGWIMKRRKNDRKEKESNNNATKPNKVSSEKKGAVVVDLTEKSENNNNSNQGHVEEDKNKNEKLKFTQILRDRIDGKFSDEDLRLLLVRVLSRPGQVKYHIGTEELNTPIPTVANHNNAHELEHHDTRESIAVGQSHEESSSSSSDDDYASDHSNNGDYGLLDSSPFALTQSFFQDTQQSNVAREENEDDLEILSSQVKREPAPVESRPLPKMDIHLPLDEDLIEVIESSGEEKMQIDTRTQMQEKEHKSPASDISPIKRSNTSIYNSSVDDWVTRKKPKTISDFFSASSRSGSLSSLSLDASGEVKKVDQSSEAVLASTTSSLKSSSSFSSKDKFAIQIEDDEDFKSPSSRSISPVKQKSQSSGEATTGKTTQSNKPKKGDKVTSSADQKSAAKKFKKQESYRQTRRLDPDDDGHDLDDFK